MSCNSSSHGLVYVTEQDSMHALNLKLYHGGARLSEAGFGNLIYGCGHLLLGGALPRLNQRVSSAVAQGFTHRCSS
jgi:hypothetical protein